MDSPCSIYRLHTYLPFLPHLATLLDIAYTIIIIHLNFFFFDSSYLYNYTIDSLETRRPLKPGTKCHLQTYSPETIADLVSTR